jgi:DNA-directed RNA polymerase specialized sigma24 family protein
MENMTAMRHELPLPSEVQPALGVRMDPGERIRVVYDCDGKRLRAFATLITGDISSGEDLAQSVFVEALQQERQNTGYLRSPAWPWLRMVAIRLANRQRIRARMQLDRLRLLAVGTAEPEWRTETIGCGPG